MYRISKNFTQKFIKYRRTYTVARDVRFGTEGKALMLQGVDLLADAVAVTLGPKGRYVILDQPFGPPIITKDGVTVAKNVEPRGKFENIGAKLVQNVAIKTSKETGDGTTTATILARSIAKAGFESIADGANPFDVRKGVLLAVDAVQENLKRVSKPIKTAEDIELVSVLAANGNDSIGKLIASAIEKVGKDGVITIKNGNKIEHELEIIEGMKIDSGYISPFFINTEKGSKVEFSNALVLVSQKKIFFSSQIIPAIEICKAKKMPLVIIAEDFDPEVLSVLILNKIKLGLPLVAIKIPGFGEQRKNTLLDLAIATGGALFEDDCNLVRLEDCLLTSLGRVKEVIVTNKTTLLLGGNGAKEDKNQRIEAINVDLEKAESDADRRKLIERVAILKGNIAVLHIGGISEVEVNANIETTRNALNATRAAIEEGVVPGGGTAFLRCIPSLDTIKYKNIDEKIGIDIIRNALKTPCETIANNAGISGKAVATKVQNLPNDYGYDAQNNYYVNMVSKGILDPTKVVKMALIDASAVAFLLTTAEAIICKLSNERQKVKQKL